jgi:hypothetical protein
MSSKAAATAMAAAAITILPTMTISSSYRALPALVVGTGHPVCDGDHRFVDFLRSQHRANENGPSQ